MQSITRKPLFVISAALLIIIFMPLSHTGLTAQERFSATFQESSTITIHGSTNINEFKLTITEAGIPTKIYNGTFIKNGSRIYATSDSIAIPVKNFKSKDPLAHSGFMKLVNEKKYPYIYLKLNNIQLPPSNISQKPQTISSNGNISLAGKTKSYNFPLKVTLNENGGYTINGRIRLTIRDFGLEPPVEFFGLVKISEWVEIDFNTNILISL